MGELLVAVAPGDMGRVKRGREVQMVYRVGAEFRLLQAEVRGARRGQIMGIDTGRMIPVGDGDYFVGQVMGQMGQHGYGGLCCDFPCGGGLTAVVEQLSLACGRGGYDFYVPEWYGQLGETSKVLVSTALSGGDLEGRFRRAMELFGRQRVVMSLDCMGEDFLIPSPQGSGEKRSREEIRVLAQTEGAEVFFSKELCGRYFTYQNGEHSLRFVLYDDRGTLEEKMRLAKLWKLAGVMGRYGDLQSWNML